MGFWGFGVLRQGYSQEEEAKLYFDDILQKDQLMIGEDIERKYDHDYFGENKEPIGIQSMVMN